MNEDTYYKVYCANCGIEGHYVKDCNNPITSFGIISFKIVEGPQDEINDLNHELRDILSTQSIKTKDMDYPKLKFLLIQRKDTMGYIDLLRGKYPFDAMKRTNKTKQEILRVFISETTPNERWNLLHKSFNEMWDNLWVNKSSRTYRHEKFHAERHFTDNFQLIKQMITDVPAKWNNSEFSFPKGRKLLKETNLKCAKREFKEETGYSENVYSVIKGAVFNETFRGTNMVDYTHIYYLAHMANTVHSPILDETNETQMGEVRNIGWFTVDEAFELMRDYDTEKKKVLLEVYEYLIKHNYSNFLNLSNSFTNRSAV